MTSDTLRQIIQEKGSMPNFEAEFIQLPALQQSCTVEMENVLDKFKGYHYHDELIEVLYVAEGEPQYIIEDKLYSLKPGDMMIAFPHTLHQVSSPNKSKRIIVNFTYSYLDALSTENTKLRNVFDYIKRTGMYKLHFKDREREKLELFLDRMSSLLTSTKFGDDLKYNVTFVRSILLLVEHISDKKDMESINYSSHPVIKKIIEFINLHLSEKISLEMISEKINLSASYISHLFKDCTGISIVQFITNKRLIRSKDLLRQGIPITDIATLCGFQDYTSFFRTFKKAYGITPKTFVKEHSINI